MAKKKKESVKDFIERQYKISFDYIKDSRKFIYFAFSIFLLFVLIGYFVPLPANLSSEFMNYFAKLVGETDGFGWIGMIAFLFHNNALSAFMGLFTGIFFGIMPFFNAILNGIVLGYVAKLVVLKEGILSLWRLFPHGIFELPALFISLGLGLKLPTFMIKENKLESLKEFLRKSVSVYVFVIIPLLVIAAIIEGTLIFLGA